MEEAHGIRLGIFAGKLALVRLLETIPHPSFRIAIHGYNQKYLLEITAGPLKQTYTVPEDRVSGPEQIRNMVTEAFLERVYQRFIDMRDDLARGIIPPTS